MTLPASATDQATSPAWRNRIVGEGEEDPRELIPNPGNWRRHPSAQAAAMTGALDQVGWVQRVLVNKRTGRMVDGHLRVELALKRGEERVPVLFVDLDEEEEKLVLASLDPLAAMAERDGQKLQGLLGDVTVDSAELARMLKALGQRSGLVDPDFVPPVPEAPYVEPGELWLLGDHRVLCGDATDPDAVARLLGDGQPTLLITDPPYGVELDPTWRDRVYNKLGPGAKPYMMAGYDNKTMSGDTIADWSPAFALVPSLDIAYVWYAGLFAVEVGQGLRALGFEIRSQIIWAKTQFAMTAPSTNGSRSRAPRSWESG